MCYLYSFAALFVLYKAVLDNNVSYDPPINLFVHSLDKKQHREQNQTMGIRQYTPSDLIIAT